jgi:NADH-quinone oxidoreductase subunit M
VAVPLLPEAAETWMPVLAWLCLGNLLYCGWVGMKQKDFSWLAGYSSVAHMGFVFLGIASLNLVGVTGAVLVMVAHGFLAALTFAIAGYIYQQTQTLEMDRLGGLLAKMPFVGTALLIAAFAGCGLPGFANFAGEVTVFFGAWAAFPTLAVLACWGGVVIGAIYVLRAVRQILHGAPLPAWEGVVDARGAWRKMPFVILILSMIVFGFFPRLLTDPIRNSVQEALPGLAGRSVHQQQTPQFANALHPALRQ